METNLDKICSRSITWFDQQQTSLYRLHCYKIDTKFSFTRIRLYAINIVLESKNLLVNYRNNVCVLVLLLFLFLFFCSILVQTTRPNFKVKRKSTSERLIVMIFLSKRLKIRCWRFVVYLAHDLGNKLSYNYHYSERLK